LPNSETGIREAKRPSAQRFLPCVHPVQHASVPTNSETGKKEEEQEGYHLPKGERRHIYQGVSQGIHHLGYTRVYLRVYTTRVYPRVYLSVYNRVYLRVCTVVCITGYTSGWVPQCVTPGYTSGCVPQCVIPVSLLVTVALSARSLHTHRHRAA